MDESVNEARAGGVGYIFDASIAPGVGSNVLTPGVDHTTELQATLSPVEITFFSTNSTGTRDADTFFRISPEYRLDVGLGKAPASDRLNHLFRLRAGVGWIPTELYSVGAEGTAGLTDDGILVVGGEFEFNGLARLLSHWPGVVIGYEARFENAVQHSIALSLRWSIPWEWTKSHGTMSPYAF